MTQSPIRLVRIFFILFVAVLSFGSGCPGGRDSYPKIESVPELDPMLNRYIASVTDSAASINKELLSAASALGKVTGKASIRRILQDMAASVPHITFTAYLNEKTGLFLTSPDSSPDITREMLTVPPELNKDRIIVHGPFETVWNDDIIGISQPVCTPAGEYIGRTALFMRIYNLFHSAAQIPGMEDYYPGVSSADGTVVYSPESYKIGSNLYNHSGEIEYLTRTSGRYYRSGFDAVSEKELLISSIWQIINLGGAMFSVSLGITCKRDPAASAIAGDGELAAYVSRLHAFALLHTKEETLKFINEESGLSSSSLYPAFAIDFGGRVLAMAKKPDLIGSRINNLSDAYEINEFSEMRLRALQGGGAVHFFVPAAADEGILSIAYVLPVRSEFLVGAVIPCLPEPSRIDPGIVRELDAKAAEILEYQDTNGEEKTREAVINDDFSERAEMLVSFVSFDGISRGQNRHPETVGVNVLERTDSHGNPLTYEMIHLAKRGGGRMYYCYTGRDGSSTLYLTRVMPFATDGLVAVSLPVESGVVRRE